MRGDAARRREQALRRQALIVAGQLPENPRDAFAVLRMAQVLVTFEHGDLEDAPDHRPGRGKRHLKLVEEDGR